MCFNLSVRITHFKLIIYQIYALNLIRILCKINLVLLDRLEFYRLLILEKVVFRRFKTGFGIIHLDNLCLTHLTFFGAIDSPLAFFGQTLKLRLDMILCSMAIIHFIGRHTGNISCGIFLLRVSSLLLDLCVAPFFIKLQALQLIDDFE